MPAKKRTDQQSKGTQSTSPSTSTINDPSAEQPHRFRHTGPNVSTRSRSNTAPSKPAGRAHLQPTHESPPTPETPYEKKLLADVPPPGARTPFTKFLYVLLFAVLLLFGWYLYCMITLFERLNEEIGWWGIISGDYSGGTMRAEAPEGWGTGPDSPGRRGGAGAEKGGLEGSLNALADALGISPMQVASAVKPLVPQASLASIASKAEPTSGSEAVKILFEYNT